MDGPFIYDKYVTGKNFFGRKKDCGIISNLLSAGEHIALYDTPKSGKTSLIQQTLFNMRVAGRQFLVAQLSLLNIRTVPAFLCRLGSTVIRTAVSSPEEYADVTARHLSGTHFLFEKSRYVESGEILSLSWDVDDSDIEAIMKLPQALSTELGVPIILILDEFQNIMLAGDWEKTLKIKERTLAAQKEVTGPKASFIFCGSMTNAMKEIFDVRRFFYRQVERYPMSRVDEREIIDHVVKGFSSGGKVIERELLLGMCKLFRNHLGYINHFASIVDSLSKGYIVENTLMEALGMLLSIHEPRFISVMYSLTTFQVSLLRAILDGHNKFSATEVIESYSLNSSANVKRLKDALIKKEVVTFNDKDEPLLLDPLFEYWVRKYYFEMQ